MPLITMKLLHDFMTNMLLNALESLFKETIKLYTQILIFLPSVNLTTRNSQ